MADTASSWIPHSATYRRKANLRLILAPRCTVTVSCCHLHHAPRQGRRGTGASPGLSTAGRQLAGHVQQLCAQDRRGRPAGGSSAAGSPPGAAGREWPWRQARPPQAPQAAAHLPGGLSPAAAPALGPSRASVAWSGLAPMVFTMVVLILQLPSHGLPLPCSHVPTGCWAAGQARCMHRHSAPHR